MLKKRIIPIQLLLHGRLVKTVQFGSYRDVGDPVASSRVYNAQNADELIFLNIDRVERTIDSMLVVLGRVSDVTFMPLTLGGGIRTADAAARLIREGADKIAVNSIAYEDTGVIESIAGEFGAQAVVVSIDAKCGPDREYVLFSDCGRRPESVTLEDHVARVIRAGAGEILVNSMDRDGVMAGYDLDLIDRVVAVSSVPVIGCGGAGHYNHLKEAFLQTGASALACGSLFNFGDSNPIRAKAFLGNYGIPFKVI